MRCASRCCGIRRTRHRVRRSAPISPKHNDPQLAKALEGFAGCRPRRTAAHGNDSCGLSPKKSRLKAQTEARQRTATEAAAYSALNAKHLPEAEERFKAILANDPENGAALAGMGYIRMNQQNFGGAISFFTQAKQNGSKDPNIDKNLATSRCFYTLAGAVALNENDLTTAEQQYRSALQQRQVAPKACLDLAARC